jgi:hypothetical protein
MKIVVLPYLQSSNAEISFSFSKGDLLLQSALQPLVGLRPAQLSLSILSRKVLQSAVASGRWNYGREMAENFAESDDCHVTFEFFYIP